MIFFQARFELAALLGFPHDQEMVDDDGLVREECGGNIAIGYALLRGSR